MHRNVGLAKFPTPARVECRGVNRQCGDHRLYGTPIEPFEQLLEVLDDRVVEPDFVQGIGVETRAVGRRRGERLGAFAGPLAGRLEPLAPSYRFVVRPGPIEVRRLLTETPVDTR